MTRIHSAGVIVVLLLAMVVAACGGSAVSNPPADGGTNAGNGTGAAASTDEGAGAAAPTDEGAAPEPGDGNGAAAGEAAEVGDQLKPPNATEVSKTTTDTYWYVLYESTDSPDTLKGYYESQIPTTGLKIISTTTTSGAFVWAIARDETGSFGGSVSVAPSGTGSGSAVIIAIGS